MRWCWINFQCRGVLHIWTRVGQGACSRYGWGLFGHFISQLSFLFSVGGGGGGVSGGAMVLDKLSVLRRSTYLD